MGSVPGLGKCSPGFQSCEVSMMMMGSTLAKMLHSNFLGKNALFKLLGHNAWRVRGVGLFLQIMVDDIILNTLL